MIEIKQVLDFIVYSLGIFSLIYAALIVNALYF